MLLVLADDFSGAAEIGGIGHRYGLNAEIQLKLDFNTLADLVVLDTNTRSLTEEDAILKISEISAAIKRWNQPIRIFKKIDSVMRGHLVAEINTLQSHFAFNRIFLLPANPNRGRKIFEGNYIINGKPLHETAFAHDPDFPVSSSAIDSRITSHSSVLKHVHVTANSTLPFSALITGDVESKSDLKKYMAATRDHDLCCGAAELFECYLENLGYTPSAEKSSTTRSSTFVLIINGTTVKNQLETKAYEKLKISQFSTPGIFNGNKFELQQQEAKNWRQKVLETLQVRRIVAISIDHPVEHKKAISQLFLNYLGGLMQHITNNIDINQIHFCITGGATASFLLRPFGESKWYVHEEVASGVVSLVNNGANRGLFTVKPGSYPWPESFIARLASSRN